MVIKRWWGAAPALLVAGMMLAAAAACAFNSPDRLNDGRGTRERPVPARVFAKTPQYEVRALSVLRPVPVEGQGEGETTDIGTEYMKVQFEVLCSRDPEEICDLTELRDNFQVVGGEGVLFPPTTRWRSAIRCWKARSSAERRKRAGWCIRSRPA